MLAFLEIVQFQQYITESAANDDELEMKELEPEDPGSNNRSLFQIIRFDPDLPQSQIVEMKEEKDMEQVETTKNQSNKPEIYGSNEFKKCKANKLFEKYIAHGWYKNALTIEIKSSDRIEDVMWRDKSQENNPIEKIMMLFDNACDDIWEGLNKSFTRYKRTEQYKQLNDAAKA